MALVLLGPAACGTLPRRGKLVMRDVNFPLRDLKLPSGLRIIVEEDRRAPVVAVVSLVGAGAASDPIGKEGLAHFVEHLTFRGRPDGKTSLWTQLERAGASGVNAFTSLDYTLYHAAAPKEALPELLRLEGQRLQASLVGIKPEVFAVEREVVRNELRERNETGYIGQVFSWLQAAAFPAGHPYARPTIGTHESLSAITLADARSFVRRYYRPENVTLVIVGDVDLAAIDKLVAEQLPPALVGQGIPVTPDPRLAATAPEPPLAPKAPMSRHEAAVATPELYIGWALPRGFDLDSSVQAFVRNSMNRELRAAMRVDGDIAGIQTGLIPGREASLLVCRIILRQGAHPEKSAEAVLDQLFRLWDPTSNALTHLVREARFRRLRVSAISGMALEAESLVDRAVRRAEFTHFTIDARAYSRMLQALSQLGASKVTDFAYKYLPRERARIIYVSPLSAVATDVGATGVGTPLPEESVELPAPPPSSVPPPGVASYRTVRLENGLEVIIGRRPGMPLVAVGLSLHGGSADTHPLGAAELSSILAFPETTFEGTAMDFGFRQQDWVERDRVQYLLEGAAGNIGNMLAILAEQMFSLHTTTQDIRTFKEYLLPYLRVVDERPEVKAERHFYSALYEAHPYGQEVTASDLEELTASAVHGWLEQTHQPANGVVAIVGEVDLDEVETLARQWLGGGQVARKATQPVAAPPSPAPTAQGQGANAVLITSRPGATQAQVQLGCLLPEADQTAAARYELLAELVGARLNQALRQDLGASYGFHGRSRVLRGGAAHLVVRGAVDNAHLPQALTALRQSVANFAQGTLRPGELERARRRLLGRYAVSHDTSSKLVNVILDARTLGLPLAVVDDYPAHLNAVTDQIVSRDFSACLRRPVLSIVGDEAVARSAVQASSR